MTTLSAARKTSGSEVGTEATSCLCAPLTTTLVEAVKTGQLPL